MGWDPVWERVFRERAWGRYPQEEVVRFVARHFYAAADRGRTRMLEIGCGPGSGASWFIAREGFSLTGVDASAEAIARARRRFAEESLAGEFVQGPVDALPFPDASFDAVIDVVCLACNSERETAGILMEVHRVLKPGGMHFSMTPRAGCWGDAGGERIDATTLREAAVGPFAGLGKIRFATRESLEALYAPFRDLSIEHVARSAGPGNPEITHWIVTCRK